MHKRGYLILSMLNFIFGVCAIFIYLPYTLEAFNIKGFGWIDYAKDVLNSDYYNALIYFGIFLLTWFIVLTFISLLSHINLPKLSFKLSTIIALILPLVFTLAIKNDKALEFWIKNIAPDVKMVSYIFLCVSWGTFGLGLVLNFIKDNRANLHIILQALTMCVLLTLVVAVNGWCGWSINLSKMFGILMALFAVYLPISSIVLIICTKKRL